MILDTNGEIFPEGTYTFRVAAVPFETEVGKYLAWQWSFETPIDGALRVYNERFMVWLLAPLLRALGFKELTPGRFDFEATEALSRSVVATIKHQTLEKGASAGKTVARMVDIKPVGGKASANRAAVAAQAPAAKDDDIPF